MPKRANANLQGSGDRRVNRNKPKRPSTTNASDIISVCCSKSKILALLKKKNQQKGNKKKPEVHIHRGSQCALSNQKK